MKVVVGECEEQINTPINSLLVMFKREWVKKGSKYRQTTLETLFLYIETQTTCTVKQNQQSSVYLCF